ncbi:MAG: chorismate synthase [Clostridiaceae bacterium]|nr:chorismate synthase [Clostridiaceae bacterium]
MPSSFGNRIRVTLFGQSHSAAMGAVIDGLPAGFPVDTVGLAAFMARRAPGGEFATKRREADEVEFLSGLVDAAAFTDGSPGRAADSGFAAREQNAMPPGASPVPTGASLVTCGAPVAFLIRNTDARSADYAKLRDIPRPSHADFTAYLKYHGFHDIRGGGQFSGRLTAPLCVAGYLCKTLLARRGVTVISHIASIGGITDTPLDPMRLDETYAVRMNDPFPVLDEQARIQMQSAIRDAAHTGDSLGGVIECGIYGFPSGHGGPFFGGIEGTLSQALFAIPAVKGVEFGAGFDFARMRGSEANDPYTIDSSGAARPASNRCGGILGGISSGMPILFRAAFKPTPSIPREQESVSLSGHTKVPLVIGGRHDPCIVPRTAVVCEAAAALALMNIEDETIE